MNNSEFEIAARDAWLEFTGRYPSSDDSNFFAAGGDSVAAVMMASTLEEAAGGEGLLETLFSSGTFGALVRKGQELLGSNPDAR